ncbi:uncharacterized protein [Drosophila virilis]|uniref:uncharacterized protein n=1 Tax=Drosophila virilis TaxID=7244 RepID=UPI0038B3DD0C
MADGDEQDASARRTTSIIQPGGTATLVTAWSTGQANGSPVPAGVQDKVAGVEKGSGAAIIETYSGCPSTSSADVVLPMQQRTEKVGAFFNPLGCQSLICKQKQVSANWSVHPSLPYQANTAVFNQATEPSTAAYMGHTGLGALNRSIAHVPRQQFDNVYSIMSNPLRCGFSNEENLIRLQKCLRGQALDAVRGKLMIPATVPYAIGTLRMLYGRSEIVHAALQQKLQEEPAIKSKNLNTVKRLALTVQNYCATIAAIGMHEYLYDPALLNELVAKMPSNMKLDWGRYRMSNEGSSLATFDNWLFNVAMCANMVTPYETPLADNEKKSSTKTNRELIFVHNTDCDDFRSMGTNQRWELVKEKKRCYCCFLRHRAQQCKSKKKCHVDGCESTHHVLLHTPTMSGSKVEHTGQGSNHRIKATNLDLPEQSIGPQLVKSRKHLSTLPILPYNNVKAQLIIGLDNIKITAPLEIREAPRLGCYIFVSGVRRVSVSSHPLRSKEDERSMEIMEATTTYLEDEKLWQTGLLWRFDRMHLPDFYQMAVKRLKCLEASLPKHPPLKEFMMNTMHDYKQKGYIRRLKDRKLLANTTSWFLPIFTVTNPSKKKTRLVWDAAAKVSGMSLNDCLLKGPDTLASLMGVLIRFRERPIAVSGDIREMFHQVKVRLEDQPAQKFLWRDGDSSRFPESYVMQHPDAVKAICKNTFVDDWLQSVDTGAEMIQLAETVKRIHASGGFEMRRWTSSSKEVIQALEDDCEELDKRISAQDEAQEKVLSLWWVPGQDLLTFVVTPNLLAKASYERPTKRRVLSVIMAIFDPVGLQGFFNIRAKIIIQNIWRSNIGWDDDLTNEDKADWQHWLDLLSNLNAVRIPRCMKWLYFCGLSLMAKYSLVASKTRVVPLKPVSIPRMELMAAVLGLRLAKCFQKEMLVRIHTRTFWTDSKDVLYWIRSDARKFQQFIALRIGEILEESDVDSWRWVPSAKNVADDGTKWTKPPEIYGSTRWFNGPPFLYLEESQWPQSEIGPALNMLYHAEEQPNHTSSWRCILPDLQSFSKLKILRAVQLCVLDFLRNITKKVRLDGGLDLQKTLLLKRSNEMDVIFIRICQE